MDNVEFRNVKANIILYRYASNKTKTKLARKYANWLKYCSFDKDGKVAGQNDIIDFLLTERFLVEDSETTYRLTQHGEHILIKGILISEGEKSINERFSIVIAYLSLCISLISFIISCYNFSN